MDTSVLHSPKTLYVYHVQSLDAVAVMYYCRSQTRGYAHFSFRLNRGGFIKG